MSSQKKFVTHSMLFSSFKYCVDFQDSHLSFEYSEDQQKIELQQHSYGIPSNNTFLSDAQKQFEQSSQSTELSNKQEIQILRLTTKKETFSNIKTSKKQIDSEKQKHFKNYSRKDQKKRTLRSQTIVERQRNDCKLVDYTYQTPSLQRISKSKPKDYALQRAVIRDQILPIRDRVILNDKNLRQIKTRKEKTFIEIHQ